MSRLAGEPEKRSNRVLFIEVGIALHRDGVGVITVRAGARGGFGFVWTEMQHSREAAAERRRGYRVIGFLLVVQSFDPMLPV
ncbi:MAG: hypothetical protein ABJ050_26220 [Paracoccaceae bacterium]